MIYSLIHPESGLGNQLFRIVAGKVLALDKGLEYSAIGRENFKGKSFMNIDFGPENNIFSIVETPAGKLVPQMDTFYNQITNMPREVWEEKNQPLQPRV